MARSLSVIGRERRTPARRLDALRPADVTRLAAGGCTRHMTDAALVAAAKAGDRDAAGTLLRRYYQDCWRYAYRMLAHQEDAEDAVQDTFFRVVRGLGRYREQDRFRPWLFCILTNVCRTALVRRRRLLQRFVNSDERDWQPGVIAAGDSPPAETDEKHRTAMLAGALQSALLQLETKQREAFLLKYGEGMEYTEMAAITGAGVSALKMRVKRACEALRPLLGEVVHEL